MRVALPDADVIIASLGNWFNFKDGVGNNGEAMWKSHAKEMLADLDAWQRQKPATRKAIVVETLMQHYTNPAPHLNV